MAQILQLCRIPNSQTPITSADGGVFKSPGQIEFVCEK